MCKVLV